MKASRFAWRCGGENENGEDGSCTFIVVVDTINNNTQHSTQTKRQRKLVNNATVRDNRKQQQANQPIDKPHSQHLWQQQRWWLRHSLVLSNQHYNLKLWCQRGNLQRGSFHQHVFQQRQQQLRCPIFVFLWSSTFIVTTAIFASLEPSTSHFHVFQQHDCQKQQYVFVIVLWKSSCWKSRICDGCRHTREQYGRKLWRQ